MKYRVKHELGNLIFMTIVLIGCFLTCYLWFRLGNSTYGIIYLTITILLMIMYYFIFYIVNDEYLLIILGFIPILIKRKSIKDVKINNNRVIIKVSFMNITLFPNNAQKFYDELNKKGK